MSVKHTFVSPKADETDATLVRPGNWNAEHTVALIDADIPATIARDAEVTADIATHAALPTVHQDAPTLIATHSGLDTGIHGAGGDTLVTDADIATHTEDLDAHTFNWMEKFKVGAYIYPYPIRGSGNNLTVADKIYAMPFFVARKLTIDRLAIQINIVDVGKIARLGIYKNGIDLYPSELVKDYGTVDVGAAATVIAATGDQLFDKGIHWLVIVSDGTPSIKTQATAYPFMGAHPTTFDATYAKNGWSKAAVGAGALADPFVSGAVLQDGRWAFCILPRIKSLD